MDIGTSLLMFVHNVKSSVITVTFSVTTVACNVTLMFSVIVCYCCHVFPDCHDVCHHYHDMSSLS